MASNFSWTKQWYPVTPVSYLDTSEPTSITLLGKRLVLWREQEGKWIAMDDTCPHKLAQLSLGKITEQGTLMCRHHGWCFDSAGKCTHMPMVRDEKALATACKSERSQVVTYPTKLLQGLLWVWPDDSSTAFADCTAKQPAVIPETQIDHSTTDWFMSEVPVGYTISVESSFDPSHAQFLHEGIAGFSPERAIPIEHFALLGEMSSEAGFTLQHSGYNIFNRDMDAKRQFTPPCSNTTIYQYANGKSVLFQLYFVPTKPGYCKHIGKFIGAGAPVKEKFWLKLLPKYLQIGLKHSSNYKLSNQDLSMMHSQAVNESEGEETWKNSYFMPAVADVGIVTFRQWLDKFAGGKPAWQGVTAAPFRELSDEQLYDRWHRHTKHCPSCRQSLLLLDKIRNLCQLLTGILVIIALLLIVINLSVKIVLIPVLLGMLNLLLFYKIGSIRHRFISSIPQQGLPIVQLY
ncbi:MAG: Rieske 2Fe-2S domain-containing protein [Symploca sp. SIO1A3]|nr:Rieske 2Fe-2S domain-containing protein [Symploca sp. SIO1A3]